MYKEHLQDIGLQSQQLAIYELLLEHGSIQAGRLSILSGLKRSLVYKILDQLISLDLASRDKGKVARFSPSHPSKIRDILDKKIQILDVAKKSLDSTLDGMISKFNLISGKPSVQFYEGKRGVQKLYDDIIHVQKDIYLFRSPYDEKHKDLTKILNTQITKQVQYSISTKAITPVPDERLTVIYEKDVERLVERRNISESEFSIPAQIIVYENKVGITSYKKGIFTTIIDNKDISDTFKKIFDQLWKRSNEPTVKDS
jgi:sugar-specific transcriptional regulator TrmB